MTNQTIDGVPRVLIAQAIEFLEARATRPSLEYCIADDLRDLLDAPVECRCKRYGKDNPHWPCPVHAAPAAQPQGEPVAWMYRREGGECLGQLVQMESDSLKDVREGKVVEGYRILWPRDDYIDWKPLYAEQPAPVAARMCDCNQGRLPCRCKP